MKPRAWGLWGVLVALAACGKPEAGPRTPVRKAKVVEEEVRAREVELPIEAIGTVEAKEEISIPARVAGILDAVPFKVGDPVTPESVLAEIDLERYRLAEARAQAELDRAEAQKNLAERLYVNRQKLQAEGKKQNKEWVTEEQMATWEADVKKAEADCARVRADLDLAKRNHVEARVKSPIAGVIQEKLVSRGEYVKPETIVATILDISALYVRFTLPEADASRLRKGQEVRFAVRSETGTGFRAKLFHLGQKIDEKTRSLECKAEILEGRERLRAGTFVSVRIVVDKRKSILIPEEALVTTEQGFVVFIAVEGKAVSKPVEVGFRSPEGVEITSGLSDGESILVDGASGLRDGVAVEVEKKP